MGPAHVSDRRGWRGAGIGTEGSKAGDSGCSGQGVRKPDGWAALGQFIPENCRVGERERGGHRSRRSTGLFAVRFWWGGNPSLPQRRGQGWLQGTKAPHGKWFQSLGYFKNELYLGEGVPTLRNYFLAPEKQVRGGVAEPGPSGAETPGLD